MQTQSSAAGGYPGLISPSSLMLDRNQKQSLKTYITDLYTVVHFVQLVSPMLFMHCTT